MTEQLKCPCGKRHGSPRGATSHISEALNPMWAAVPERVNVLHNPLPPPSDAVRDATDEHRRRVNARWAADRAMARARRRG